MSSRYPLLWEVGPERPAAPAAAASGSDGAAEGGRPAASPVWTNSLSRATGPPSIPGVQTLYDSFRLSCERHPAKRCLGRRPVSADGAAGPFEFISYGEAQQQAVQVASACRALGLKRCDKVGVLGVNCPEWMLAMQACNRMAYVCVPLYDTLGPEAVEFIMSHAGVQLVFVEGPRMGRMVQALQQGHRLQALVYWGSASKADIKAVEATGHKVLSWADVIKLGSAKPAPADPPKPDDLSTIMYTSGTTGDPKGVMITHANLVSAIAGCNQYLESFNESLGQEDSYLSFLPLAHVFDRLAEEFMLLKGGCVGYWRGEIPKVLDDIMALRPTLFCGVPRVFDRVYAGIFEQLRSGPAIKLLVFQLCLWAKSFWMKRGVKHDKAAPLADLLAFNKIKKKLGGNVRIILSGAAPLSTPVQEVLSCAMCAPVLQGYGLTETCAASTIAEPFKWDTIGTVGGPMPGVEIRLEAVPDMGYFPDAEPPAGEVCIRGPALFKGYYRQPELTRECMDEDGFFHTGDIARLVGRGTLQIVDRKKNIFKLAQGEYVAVEKIESVYKRCPLLEQIWVYGNSFESCLVAVVVPQHKAIMAWAAAKGLQGTYEEVCVHPSTKQYLLDELTAVGKAGKLRGFELVKAIHTDSEQFTVENNLSTPTHKLKRPQLQAHYQAPIDRMYAELRGDSSSSRMSSRAVSRTASSRAGSKGGAQTDMTRVLAKAL